MRFSVDYWIRLMLSYSQETPCVVSWSMVYSLYQWFAVFCLTDSSSADASVDLSPRCKTLMRLPWGELQARLVSI